MSSFIFDDVEKGWKSYQTIYKHNFSLKKMHLIFKTDFKVQYILEIFDDDTLQTCLQKIQSLFQIPRRNIQFLSEKGASPLELNKPVSDLGLSDGSIVFIDFLNDRQNEPKKAKKPQKRNLIISRNKSLDSIDSNEWVYI